MCEAPLPCRLDGDGPARCPVDFSLLPNPWPSCTRPPLCIFMVMQAVDKAWGTGMHKRNTQRQQRRSPHGPPRMGRRRRQGGHGPADRGLQLTSSPSRARSTPELMA